MPKPPPNVPSLGDRCRLRGKGICGELKHVSPTDWAVVHWDVFKSGPGIVHLHELEKI